MRKALFFLILFFFILQLNLYPSKFKVGAFDPPYWNGIVLIKQNDFFAFRFIIKKDDTKVDGYDTFFIVEDVGIKSPYTTYAEISFNPFLPLLKEQKTPILVKNPKNKNLFKIKYGKWENGIIGKLTIPDKINIDILFYSPWDNETNYYYKNNKIYCKKHQKFVFIPQKNSLKKVKNKKKMIFRVKNNLRTFYFYSGFDHPEISKVQIENILIENKRIYLQNRPKIKGEWSGLIEAIYNNISWMKLCQPDKNRVYLPAGRRWIFPKPDGTRDLWTIFEWDAFFNALESSVEDCNLAKNEIQAVLDTQYEWGNIPNWRSANNGSRDRSQPPVGSFAVLKTYFKCNDKKILEKSYERLKKWHNFWKNPSKKNYSRRDGNRNELLEWGSDTSKIQKGVPEWEIDAPGRQRAAWESGQDDLPNFDDIPFSEKKGTLKMDCIDLSALYTLDTEMLKIMAKLLGKKDDFEIFKSEYKTMKKKINRNLWNKDKNFYFDKFWNGKFSEHKAASNFYPLIAGIPDRKKAKNILSHLLNPEEFWGEYVIPTISRDNPAFKDQQYWRGTIWPPTNYLVYQGLKRYKFDKAASNFAIKSAKLFMESWEKYRLCRENYNSITGKGGGQRYQSWGPLFALILLEDFVDYTPFEGLRVGNISASKKNILENIKIKGSQYKLYIYKDNLCFFKNNRKIFKFSGEAVLRNIIVKKDLISFEANILSDKITFYPLIFSDSTIKVKIDGEKTFSKTNHFKLNKGLHKVKIIL